LGISAAVARFRSQVGNGEIHWVMTNAWTFPDSPWWAKVLTPLTRWAFPRAGAVYNFIPMPPIPPSPQEMEARASAVLRTVRLARTEAANGI
jgi:hypothetical protein